MNDTGNYGTSSSDRNNAGASGSDRREQATGQAREDARAMGQQAREEAGQRADQQKVWLADQLGSVAAAMRSMGMQFKDQQQLTFADYTYRLADRTDGFADTLRDRDSESLLSQAQQLARQQPAMFVGGMVATGFLLSRFLKSSQRHGSDSDNTTR